MAYIRGANPIWYMVTHTGLPLNDEYYAFFLSNTFPYTPQVPARDPNGLTFWTGGIVQFQPSGTLPNNLYFNDELTYRIEIRHGNTQNDPLIWEINNYQPGSSGSNPDGNLSLTSDNQVSNPQFSYVSFNGTAEISSAGDHEIAPGWFLELTGSGSVSVSQVRTLSGSDNIPGNPAYALSLNISGWTTAYLRQRFSQNGSLFSGTSAINPSGITMSVTARANDNIQNELTLSYRQEGASIIPVANGILNISNYAVIDGATTLDLSANNTSNPASYTDMLVQLPVGSANISLTNLQVVGQFSESTPVALPFEQEPVERQLDHLFHYYADSILRQPKSNLLTGWVFGLNPWQFRTTSSSNVAVNEYTADQTIVIQQAYVSSATGNNIAVGRGGAGENYSFEVTAVTANNQFGILQYIDPATIRPYWGDILSCLASARISTSHSSTVAIKARLIYRSGLPNAVSQTDPVQSWTLGGDPVFSAGWTSISPLNDPEYTLTSGGLSFAFDKMLLPASDNASMTLGLFIYTTSNMNEASVADKIHFDKVSLVPNDFAIEASPETFDECLRKCQFYYEKSYSLNVLEGTNTNVGKRYSMAIMPKGALDELYRAPFELVYNTVKCKTPTNRIYTPAGTSNSVRMAIMSGTSEAFGADVAISGFDTSTNSEKSIVYINSSTAKVGDVLEQPYHVPAIFYHYVSDARLGV